MSETETQTEEGTSVEEEVEETVGEVEETVEETVEEVEETVEETLDEVEGTVEEGRERVEETLEDQRERVEETLEDGLEAVNDSVVDVISVVLDTGARADVYVALRKLGEADVDEIAEETGLYPEKVEDILEGLVEDEVVESVEVGDSEAYTAISPTDLVANLPRRLADRVRGFVESVEEEVESGVEGDDGRRVLSANWAPYRVIIEPNDDESEETEIPVQG